MINHDFFATRGQQSVISANLSFGYSFHVKVPYVVSRVISQSSSASRNSRKIMSESVPLNTVVDLIFLFDQCHACIVEYLVTCTSDSL